MPVLPPAIVTITGSNTFPVWGVPPLAENNCYLSYLTNENIQRNVNKLFSQDFLGQGFWTFLVREVGNRFEEP